MSRKSSQRKEIQMDSMPSYNNYPQPYEVQQMMNPMMNNYPMSGISPYNNGTNNNPMFFYEPVPIRKRNRSIFPLLMFLAGIVSFVVAAVAVLFLADVGFVAGLLGPIKEFIGGVSSSLTEGLIGKIVLIVAIGLGIDVVLQVIIGIFRIIAMCHISQEVNLIASEYDFKTTPFYALAVFLGILTLGIYTIIYYNSLCARIGSELKRRSIRYKFDEGTYWGWAILGSLLVGIGPIVFFAKFFKAMKKLTSDYNTFG